MKKLLLILALMFTLSIGFSQARDEDWIQEAENSGKATTSKEDSGIGHMIAVVLCVCAIPVALVLIISDRKRRNALRSAYSSGDYSGFEGFDDYGGHDDE